MAQPTTLRGSLMLIEIGDGGSPEVFDNPCGLTAKSFSRSSTVNDITVPDCDDPDAPAWIERVKDALSGTITGSGILAKEYLAAYESFLDSLDPRNVKITLDYTSGPIEYSGLFHLTTFTITGERGSNVNVELELQSHGAITYDASP